MKYLIGAIVGSMVGLAIGFGLGTSKYKGELDKIMLKIKDVEDIDKIQSIDKVIEILEKKLAQKELEVKRMKEENNKMSIKLANLENQFTELLNDMMKQGNENRRQSFVDSKDNREEQKGKKSPEELMKEISSLIEKKDIIGVAKLLRQLAAYGKEYYKFIFDTMKKMSEDSSKYIRGLEILKVLGAPEFVDYYKWIIEDPQIVDPMTKWRAVHSLVWAGGEEVKPFLFEQFKVQTDPKIKSTIFGVLQDNSEYKNTFIEVAKDLSQDPQLRRRIILEYRNDNSPEVQNLFNFLKTNEVDEYTKKMVNIISEVRNNNDKGYVVFKGGEILKEKDIVLKVGDIEINSEHQLEHQLTMRPFMGQQGGTAKNTDENITLTVKREGTIITVNIPKSKLRQELSTIEGAYIATK